MEANGRRTSNSLAEYGWQTSAVVENWLFAEGYKFDFFQAVRLLEMMQAADQPQAVDQKTSSRNGTRKRRRLSPGEGADPSKEIVHFKSAVRLDFPTSDVAELRFPARDFLKLNRPNGDHGASEMVADFKHQETPAEMTVNFLGLAGGLGALDIPTTESVLRQQSRNDQPFRDFLDIFNHRLVSLLYRIRKHHRVGLGVDARRGSDVSPSVFANRARYSESSGPDASQGSGPVALRGDPGAKPTVDGGT